jgi:hypothetical protein
MTLAREGTRAYTEAFDLIHRHEATGPNAVWQADHTELDIWLKDGRGQPEKPWLTIILDDYSRAIAGYALSFSDPSAIQTALALRQAIWRKGRPGWQVCGIPGILYSDHGSDFTSRHLEQVAAEEVCRELRAARPDAACEVLLNRAVELILLRPTVPNLSQSKPPFGGTAPQSETGGGSSSAARRPGNSRIGDHFPSPNGTVSVALNWLSVPYRDAPTSALAPPGSPTPTAAPPPDRPPFAARTVPETSRWGVTLWPIVA